MYTISYYTTLCLFSSGASGKRTRYQRKNIAQLLLSVQRLSDNKTVPSSADSQVDCNNAEINIQSASRTGASSQSDDKPPLTLPKNELLEDDTVLEKIELCDEGEITNTKLNWIEECLILALWLVIDFGVFISTNLTVILTAAH